MEIAYRIVVIPPDGRSFNLMILGEAVPADSYRPPHCKDHRFLLSSTLLIRVFDVLFIGLVLCGLIYFDLERELYSSCWSEQWVT